jgi:hypothetical protein
MSVESTSLPASIEIFGAAPTPVVVQVVRQPLGSRLMRAGFALALALPLAVAAVFIPLAHFVLVPGVLVAGGVIAANRLREEWRLARVLGVCPRCRQTLDVAPGGRFKSGRTFECPHCLNTLTLVAPAPGRDDPASRSA